MSVLMDMKTGQCRCCRDGWPEIEGSPRSDLPCMRCLHMGWEHVKVHEFGAEDYGPLEDDIP